MTPFLIFTKARSRSFWLSRWLTHGGWTVHHDPSLEFHDLTDLARLLLPGRVGIVDTSLGFRWRDALGTRPDARVVTVRRPILDCHASLEAMGLATDATLAYLLAMEDCLDEIERSVPCFRIDFERMGNARSMRQLWRHCFDGMEPWDGERFRTMNKANLQVDMDAELRRVIPKLDRLNAFYGRAVKARIEGARV